MRSYKDIENQYKQKEKEEKEKIKSEPNKWKRFWKWVLFILVFPFKWIWVNIRDLKTAIIFIIVFLVLASEVWVPYLLGLIFINVRAALWSFGTLCWAFWLGPGTPFLPLCIGTTIGIKALFNKIITNRASKKETQKNK